MSGVVVDRCVGAREPNPVRIQIASATGGGNCSVCTGAVVSRAPEPWLVSGRCGLFYSHFGQSSGTS
jgi:hypothetical protein